MAVIFRRPTTRPRSRSLNKTLRLIGCVAALVMTSQMRAAPTEIICPAEVPVSAIQVRAPTSDWVPFIDDPAKLVGAGAASGPPGSYATLVGERNRPTGANTQSVKFRFDQDHPRDGNWIECVYGGRPEISFFKRLQDDVTECTIETNHSDKSKSAQVHITCRR